MFFNLNGKILQILIIENRDLAHAQTFCTRATAEHSPMFPMEMVNNVHLWKVIKV